MVKSLEGFTKAQRRNPDLAVSDDSHSGFSPWFLTALQRCIMCVNEHFRAPVGGVKDVAKDEVEPQDAGSDDGATTNTNPFANASY